MGPGNPVRFTRNGDFCPSKLPWGDHALPARIIWPKVSYVSKMVRLKICWAQQFQPSDGFHPNTQPFGPIGEPQFCDSWEFPAAPRHVTATLPPLFVHVKRCLRSRLALQWWSQIGYEAWAITRTKTLIIVTIISNNNNNHHHHHHDWYYSSSLSELTWIDGFPVGSSFMVKLFQKHPEGQVLMPLLAFRFGVALYTAEQRAKTRQISLGQQCH